MSRIDWNALRKAFEEVEYTGADHGRVRVRLGNRQQWVQVRANATASTTLVVRLSSDAMTRQRALKALLIPSRQSEILLTEEDEADGLETSEPPPEERSSHGRRLLDLMGHNDRLQGVHLHIDAERLRVSSDLVCLSGTIDMALLQVRIQRLARIADGMELRATGSRDRF